MKSSKIILSVFFLINFVVALFYLVKILGASPSTQLSTDYYAKKLNTTINTIIVEDGWRIQAHLGEGNTDSYFGYPLGDSGKEGSEAVLRNEVTSSGLVMSKYYVDLDRELVNNIEVNGDTLLFRRLNETILGSNRIRLNLPSIQRVILSGDSYLSLSSDSDNETPLQLDQLNIKMTDEASVSLDRLNFGILKVDANGYSRISYRLFNTWDNRKFKGYLADKNKDEFQINSDIHLSGNSRFSLGKYGMSFSNYILKDEARITWTGHSLETRYGKKTRKNPSDSYFVY